MRLTRMHTYGFIPHQRHENIKSVLWKTGRGLTWEGRGDGEKHVGGFLAVCPYFCLAARIIIEGGAVSHAQLLGVYSNNSNYNYK